MELTKVEIARMIDLSAVRADCNEEEVRAVAAMAKQHQCIAVFALPAFMPLVVELLADSPQIKPSGTIGFPSGGETTTTKQQQATELIQMGCRELDMVINIGKLRSGRYQEVEDDIRAVAQSCGKLPLKVILECHYLTNDQIRKACELCLKAGAAFVKTGTGWAPTGATLENIALMKSCVGNACGIKAAGGVRDLATLLEMHRLGATRFGIGLRSASDIFAECDKQPNLSSMPVSTHTTY